jgi:transcriptional regulator with XRE-family HTH domain
MTFGDLLREARLDQGLSQDALAAAAELHHTHISLLERGRRDPTLETLVRLARGLGVTPSALIADYGRVQR